MTCTHIRLIKQRLKNFTKKFGDYDSSIYEKLDSIVNKGDIGAKLDVIYKGFFSGTDYKAIATYKDYSFHYISQKSLKELCDEIDCLLSECKCYQDVIQDSENKKEKDKGKKKYLRGEIVVKGEEISDLQLEKKESETELKIFKGLFENEKERLEGDKREVENELKLLRELVSQLREEKARVENDNDNLKKELGGKKKGESILEQERNDLIKKEGEIKILREKLLQTLEEKLDYFIGQLEIEESEKLILCQTYENLYWAREISSLNEIRVKEKEINEIKKELKNKLKIQSVVQEFSKMCSEIAKLKIELGQSQYEGDQKQKFEAKMEVPPKN